MLRVELLGRSAQFCVAPTSLRSASSSGRLPRSAVGNGKSLEGIKSNSIKRKKHDAVKMPNC